MRVTIIGGGAVGLFCAWRLAQKRAQVELIEPRPLADVDPTAASWAAAGMLGAVSEALAEPADRAGERVALGLAAIEAWSRAERDLSPVASLFPLGSVTLGDAPHRTARLQALADLARASGAGMDVLSPRDIAERGLAVAPHVEAGLFAPFERLVNIPSTLHGLRDRAAAAGVRFIQGVASGLSSGARLALETAAGVRISCDVIVAAPGIGPYRRLAQDIPALARLTPSKGQMALLGAALPCVVRADGAYLAPRPEGLVVGATMEPGRADFAVDPKAIETLRRAAVCALPHLADAQILRAWAGVRPMSPDGAPLVGPSGPPGCFAAAGHSRNGWLLAPLTAEIIADLVFGKSAAPAAFDPGRFEPKDQAP
jgi:glycine oxidase